MPKPHFSIIIPALNEARYLPKLLGDLATQSYRDFEVIVVDGQSDDATVAKAKTFSRTLPHLNILTSPKRHVCVQRNLGATKARGDILIFMDADNRLPPYFLQGIKYRWESSNADILSTWLAPDVTNNANNTISFAINTFIELQNNLKPTYLVEAMIIISKKCFTAINGFDESIDYAEGKSIIQPAVKMGYSSLVVRDPIYSTSFRRFRKYGIAKMASHIARLELAKLLGPEFKSYQTKKLYPMVGGTLFNKPKRVKNKFLKNIAKLLKDF